MLLNIDVAIRVKPHTVDESEKDKKIEWKVRNDKITRVEEKSLKRKKQLKYNEFLFDEVFNVEHTNFNIYDKFIKRTVNSAMVGCNGTVIAYGQCGSGKTHTMYGTPDDPGIIPLAVDYMFCYAEKNCKRRFSFKVSCIEIFKEQINDLIDNNNRNLKLKKSISNLVQIIGCKEEAVSNSKSVLEILKICEKNYKIEENDLNIKSDKSHKILRISIESKDIENDCYSQHKFSQLYFMDLAGHKSLDSYESKEDYHNIMSLTLLNIINIQLNKSSDVKNNINFSGSKLTECLSNSFKGNSKTAFVCTLSLTSLEETQKTLWFASRAKNLVTKPKINTIFSYKWQLITKICTFHKYLKERIKMLLHELIKVQEKSHISGCISNVMKKINYDSSKLTTVSMPVINENDIFCAIEEFKQDLEKMHQKLTYLVGIINSDKSVLDLLQSIESDLDLIEPKAVLLETFINVLMTEI